MKQTRCYHVVIQYQSFIVHIFRLKSNCILIRVNGFNYLPIFFSFLFSFFSIFLWLLLLRVSLTYRVKSAHKLKLTDQQLLSWMMPIIFVMAVYLGAWTLSAPPHGETVLTGTMKFTQCSYNWWDHSLAIGKPNKSMTLTISNMFLKPKWVDSFQLR